MILVSFRRSSPMILHILWILGNVLLVNCDWLMDCGDCICKWNSGKKAADCGNRSLTSIPENLNSELQVLDISFNRIVYLEENAFLNAHLHNLHKLYIRNSSVQIIHSNCFNSLHILIELDLTNNLLRSLDQNVFSGLRKIRYLILNDNLLQNISNGIFQNLKYLHKIELKNNCIIHIDTNAFADVPLLAQIYLDGNKLNTLRKETFESIKALKLLSLDHNPWNCTCQLQEFRDFVLNRHFYTSSTSCFYPAQLRGVLWVDENVDSFPCRPHIIYPTHGSSISTSKENVTLICRVHASLKTIISWDYKKSFPNNPNRDNRHRLYIQLVRDDQFKDELGAVVFISRLTIIYAGKSDEGIYTCLARNAGGQDAAQIKLIIENQEQIIYLHRNFIVMTSLMTVGIIWTSAFPAAIIYNIYKHFKNAKPSRQHLNFGRTMIIPENGIITNLVPFNENLTNVLGNALKS